MFIYNYMPAACWGSPEAVEEWGGLHDQAARGSMRKTFMKYREEHYETA